MKRDNPACLLYAVTVQKNSSERTHLFSSFRTLGHERERLVATLLLGPPVSPTPAAPTSARRRRRGRVPTNRFSLLPNAHTS